MDHDYYRDRGPFQSDQTQSCVCIQQKPPRISTTPGKINNYRKIKKNYLQVPIIPCLIIYGRFQVLNLPGGWKFMKSHKACFQSNSSHISFSSQFVSNCVVLLFNLFHTSFLVTCHTSFSHLLFPSPGFLQSPEKKKHIFFKCWTFLWSEVSTGEGSYICSKIVSNQD